MEVRVVITYRASFVWGHRRKEQYTQPPYLLPRQTLVPKCSPGLSPANTAWRPWHLSSPSGCLLWENPACVFLRAGVVVLFLLRRYATLPAFPHATRACCTQAGFHVRCSVRSTSDTYCKPAPNRTRGRTVNARKWDGYCTAGSSSPGTCMVTLWHREKSPFCRPVTSYLSNTR